MAENRDHLKKRKSKITYGVIVGVILIVAFFLYYFANLTAVNGG
ncbi:hypothetical protein [Paenibacillus sp. Marseille-Q4541]|nr:hypothetical protein [Paenibacillus sp. Marseille-Q4541]